MQSNSLSSNLFIKSDIYVLKKYFLKIKLIFKCHSNLFYSALYSFYQFFHFIFAEFTEVVLKVKVFCH